MKMKHNNKGFSLVELIVVIAIMAILGGVGTVGYSKYIENTNKKADMALVGNIMRAIETGTNSTMFINDDSFKVGSIAYPVGFITLSNGDTKVITSQNKPIYKAEGKCNIQTINVSYVKKESIKQICPVVNNGSKKNVYSLDTKSITCCLTHSEFADTTNIINTDLATEYVHDCKEETACGEKNCPNAYNWTPSKTLSVPAGTPNFILDENKLYEESSTNGMCELAYANQHGRFETTNAPSETDSGALFESLKFAFGDNFQEELTLKYDKWTSSEGINYATFYADAPELMTDIETLSGLLVLGSKIADLGLSQDYDNSEEVLIGVGTNITSTHTKETWLTEWMDHTTMTWDSEGFGLSGRENYSAARMGYNSGFASYMKANGQSEFADTVKNFYTQGLAGVGLPGLVCADAFTDTNSKLREQLSDVGATEEDIKQIADLYDKYKESDACRENGAVLYDCMSTFSETSDIANAYTDLNGGDIYDYYNSYVNEISAMYTAAQEFTGDGIVIIVTVEEGKLNFHVSPTAANPREK